MSTPEKDAMDDRWKDVLAGLWQEQSRWSKRADELKRSYRSWTGPLVAAGFIGVVLSTLSPELVNWLPGGSGTGAAPERSVLQILAVLAGPLIVAIAAALTRELRGATTDQNWAKARGIAEALKAQGYLFAAGAPPYSNADSAPEQLATAIEELNSAAPELAPLPAAATDLSRHPHEAIGVKDYVARRVTAQAEYHEREAIKYGRQLGHWRACGLALAAISAGLGVFAGLGTNAAINVWVAVVTTAIATLTSFIYASRFEFFAATYFATATRLRSRLRIWEAARDKSTAERDRFILETEAILAAQNQGWMTELSKRAREELDALQRQRADEPAAT
jgi:hypothetical protein